MDSYFLRSGLIPFVSSSAKYLVSSRALIGQRLTIPCKPYSSVFCTSPLPRFDKNGDGRISCVELRDVLTALGSKPDKEEVDRIMKEIDKDGDGFIDMKEFEEFHIANGGVGGGNSKELKDAFDLYDRDKNGLISASELHAVLKSLGEKVTLKDCSKMISNVDIDGDGCVNFEEFKKMMKSSA